MKTLRLFIFCFFVATSAFAEEVRVLYENDSGMLCVLTPSTRTKLSLEEIIAKDVPQGKQYKIVKKSDIPADRKNRSSWKQSDFSWISISEAKTLHAEEKRRKK